MSSSELASGSVVSCGKDSIQRPGGAGSSYCSVAAAEARWTALPTPDAAVLPARSEPSDRVTVAVPLMAIAPPDSSAAFCSKMQRANDASAPSDAKTAPPR